MEETVNVVPPLPQGVWRGCSSQMVAKQLPRYRSAPLLAACEGAFDGRPDSRWRATCAAAIGDCSTGTVAPGAGRREARGADDATPSAISTSSSWWECSTTRTMEMSKR